MWNNTDTSFDSQGGGFLTSKAGGSPNFNSSQDQTKKFSKHENIVPCTTAQIHKIPMGEDHVTIGSLTATTITLIGQIADVEESSTKVVISLDDKTGKPLLVNLWLDEAMTDSPYREYMQESTYIRVTGTVRTVKDIRQLIAFKISPVDDVNEILMHMAEIIHVGMSIEMMDKQPTPMQTDFKSENTSVRGISGGFGGVGNIMEGLNPQQNMVFQALKPFQNEDGASIDDMAEVLPSLKKPTIKTILEFLCNEGHAYTTTDDLHFKATDA